MQTERNSTAVTYAHVARSVPGRAFVHLVESATGRPGLIRRARGYQDDLARGADFWRVMMQRYGLWLDVARGSLDDIPRDGPLVLVANHPFGILDGLVMGHLLSATRPQFRILAHSAFGAVPVLQDIVLPLDFSGSSEAVRRNVATRAAAVRHLEGGGAVGVFPGGTVSTAAHPLGQPMDPVWRGFTARMIAKTGATVVPIWFDGSNSRLFQIASHLNYTLRMALLIREFGARTDRPVRLCVGRPITAETLAPMRDQQRAMMAYLRAATYALAPADVAQPAVLGHEFEAHHRQLA